MISRWKPSPTGLASASPRSTSGGRPRPRWCWPCSENESLSPCRRRPLGTAEEAIRDKARALIGPLNGHLGKVLSELIAEGRESEPAILRGTV